ncbi:hypothetical protein TL16_g09124 [Triparma laevis f. inornata]|uniref:PH domain-containing protein n=1 Tax=Triparma laevis f. inornata TaxID=1714386 RepID=A0A9W7EM07_9STRA|nr:hypothetical protein TL16_g09124 [Triparma laevis f. inornata]
MSPPQIVFTPSPTITAESGHYTPHLLAWTGSGKEEGVKGVENSGMLNGTPSGYTTNEVTLSTTSLINSPLALTSTLHKKGSTSRSWLPRLCVLKSSYIFYFPSEKLTTPASGCVPLFGCILTLPENGMRVFKYHKSTSARSGFEFCVTTQIGVNKNRKFFFTAETEGNRREWVEGIKGGREEYGSECHLKVESLSKVDSVEGANGD